MNEQATGPVKDKQLKPLKPLLWDMIQNAVKEALMEEISDETLSDSECHRIGNLVANRVIGYQE